MTDRMFGLILGKEFEGKMWVMWEDVSPLLSCDLWGHGHCYKHGVQPLAPICRQCVLENKAQIKQEAS